MEMNLNCIRANYGFLLKAIMQHEKQKLSLNESIATVKFVENKVNYIIGEAGIAIKEKLKNVLEKTRDFNDLEKKIELFILQ